MAALAQPLLERLLDAFPVARLGLVDTSDQIEVLPIVFARVGMMLYSPVDGKPKKHPRLSRLAAIRRVGEVGLVLDHYDQDWEQLWWVKLDVSAQVVGQEDKHWSDAETALRLKYPQYQSTPLFSGTPTAIAMHVTRVRWWASCEEQGLVAWLEQHAVPANAAGSQ